MFFISFRPQFLVNRAPSAETLRIAILGQSMCTQPSRQQACVVVKLFSFLLMPLKMISFSFFFKVVSMAFSESLLKTYRPLLIYIYSLFTFIVSKWLSYPLWQRTNLQHKILVGKIWIFYRSGSSEIEDRGNKS